VVIGHIPLVYHAEAVAPSRFIPLGFVKKSPGSERSNGVWSIR
jgi:hypothetical protein